MFAFRAVCESEVVDHPVIDLAFTDRTLDLSLPALDAGGPPSDEAVVLSSDELRRAASEFATDGSDVTVVGMHQVHGADVVVVDASSAGDEPVADALVSNAPGVALLVRTADCVPILLADVERGVIGAVHAGREGLVAGVVPAALTAMRRLGAGQIRAWVGPHVCGGCYEVPASMREEIAVAIPETFAETTWGTPALDLGAGVSAQLDAHGVSHRGLDRCTREDESLWSYRRDGDAAGRLGALIRIRP